jgi:hypothetical protein
MSKKAQQRYGVSGHLGVLVRVSCRESGAFHERKGSTQFGPFRRPSDGEWYELRSHGAQARRAAERRGPDPAFNSETGTYAEGGPTRAQPGRKARLSDITPGLRPRVTRFVRQDGQPVSERDEARVEEAMRWGTRTTARGRLPADPADMEACRQFVFRCGCGLSRTMKVADVVEIFDQLAAAGVHDIELKHLIREHERRVGQ